MPTSHVPIGHVEVHHNYTVYEYMGVCLWCTCATVHVKKGTQVCKRSQAKRINLSSSFVSTPLYLVPHKRTQTWQYTKYFPDTYGMFLMVESEPRKPSTFYMYMFVQGDVRGSQASRWEEHGVVAIRNDTLGWCPFTFQCLENPGPYHWTLCRGWCSQEHGNPDNIALRLVQTFTNFFTTSQTHTVCIMLFQQSRSREAWPHVHTLPKGFQ